MGLLLWDTDDPPPVSPGFGNERSLARHLSWVLPPIRCQISGPSMECAQYGKM